MKKIAKCSEYHISGVYAIKNLRNDKVYVGSTYDICKRIYIHRRDLQANKHHSVHLQRSWNLYGAEDFEFFLVESVEDVLHLLEREQYWMDEFQSCNKHKGYNMSPTAGSCRGVKLSEEHKEKIRQAHLGKPLSEEHKRKVSEAHKRNPYWRGKSHNEETKKKISSSKVGVKQHQSTCDKRNNSIRQGGSRKSLYKGVCWDVARGKWIAQMKVNRKNIQLGRFDDAKEAAENYDYHMCDCFPDAFLNFPDKDYSSFVPKRLHLTKEKI